MQFLAALPLLASFTAAAIASTRSPICTDVLTVTSKSGTETVTVTALTTKYVPVTAAAHFSEELSKGTPICTDTLTYTTISGSVTIIKTTLTTKYAPFSTLISVAQDSSKSERHVTTRKSTVAHGRSSARKPTTTRKPATTHKSATTGTPATTKKVTTTDKPSKVGTSSTLNIISSVDHLSGVQPNEHTYYVSGSSTIAIPTATQVPAALPDASTACVPDSWSRQLCLTTCVFEGLIVSSGCKVGGYLVCVCH